MSGFVIEMKGRWLQKVRMRLGSEIVGRVMCSEGLGSEKMNWDLKAILFWFWHKSD